MQVPTSPLLRVSEKSTVKTNLVVTFGYSLFFFLEISPYLQTTEPGKTFKKYHFLPTKSKEPA